ncbi:cysteine-rich venom protein Mr30-like isoform X1 [Dreissena polymorpha]|uniref:cysteine-rich venom protein Mr30-like isoform X1 n=2 Tax=Dreissena polymorpha TaxID=45954 RepID=UPI002263BE6C|nr:cysteine-rich venom protein Mr30-like isoform X1 [Dreissena polymorpha]
MERVTVLILTLINIEVFVQSQTPPNLTCYSPRPFNPSCTDKYAAFPGHLNCEDQSLLVGSKMTITDKELTSIADEHNRIRSNVVPKAANMLDMHDNQGLETAALRWARRCTADSTWYQRSTPGAFIPGQNYLFSETPLNWTDVLAVWEAENTSFTYGGPGNDATRVGNYTQMIWSETASVGCGAADCGGRYLYICLYAPILDPSKRDQPYKPTSSAGCDDCQRNCTATTKLCDFKGLLCLGGSKVNMTTGSSCDCLDNDHYNGTICELKCVGTNDTDPECFKTLRGTCSTNLTTMFRCPWMCNVCPYAASSWGTASNSRMPWEKDLPACTTTTAATSHLPNVVSSSTSDQGPGQDNSGGAAAAISLCALMAWAAMAVLLADMF